MIGFLQRKREVDQDKCRTEKVRNYKVAKNLAAQLGNVAIVEDDVQS
jgi:hypothetical protein